MKNQTKQNTNKTNYIQTDGKKKLFRKYIVRFQVVKNPLCSAQSSCLKVSPGTDTTEPNTNAKTTEALTLLHIFPKVTSLFCSITPACAYTEYREESSLS